MNQIIIPNFVVAKPFHNNKLFQALANCQSKGYSAQFIPEIMDSRSISDRDNDIWTQRYSAPSVIVTGTTKNGSKVVVYAHVPNYFSHPKNIKKALPSVSNGAGIYPEKELHRLIALEDGERVSVLDYDIATKAKSGRMSLDDARENPHTKAFIGGEARTEKCLAQHKQVVGNTIGVYHSDDMDTVPRARLLFADNWNNYGYLYGSDNLSSFGRFVGVRDNVVGVAQKSPLETLIGKGRDVGNGIIVMNKESMSKEAYNLVTGKYLNQ